MAAILSEVATFFFLRKSEVATYSSKIFVEALMMHGKLT